MQRARWRRKIGADIPPSLGHSNRCTIVVVFVRHQIDQDDIAARDLEYIAADHFVAPIIGALDQRRRAHAFDQVEHRPVEHDLFLRCERCRGQDAMAQFGERDRGRAAFATHDSRGGIGRALAASWGASSLGRPEEFWASASNG